MPGCNGHPRPMPGGRGPVEARSRPSIQFAADLRGAACPCRSAGRARRHSRKRIARLMREAGLVGASHRRGGPITTRRDKEPGPRPTWSTATSARRGRTSCGSPTSPICRPRRVSLSGGRARRLEPPVVGWAMANHLRAELVLDALEMAVGQRRPQDVIHHCDQGSQYTSLAFGKRCGRPAFAPRWARSATPTTTPWPRASSPPSRPSCSPAVALLSGRSADGLLQLHRRLLQLLIRTHISLCS